MTLNRLTDRCDSCGAQAFVRVVKGEGELLFCGHHFKKHEADLFLQGFTVGEDERETVNEKPSVSANAD